MEHYENNPKALRKAKGHNQQEVAKLMNLQCEAQLSEWENGIALSYIHNLLRLCEIYDVSTHIIFQRK